MGLFKEDPEPAEVLGKPLRCQVCGNEGFYKRESSLFAQLHAEPVSAQPPALAPRPGPRAKRTG